jgi:hypothetical protein
MKELSTASSQAPDVINTVRVMDYVIAEKFLHEQFAQQRVRGEWFTLDAEQVAYLTSLRDDTFYTEASV